MSRLGIVGLIVVVAIIYATTGSDKRVSTSPPPPTAAEKAAAEKAATEAFEARKRERREKFTAQRDTVLKEVKSLLAKQQWTKAYQVANEYYDVDDPELQRMLKLADDKSSAETAAAAKRDAAAKQRETKRQGVLIGMTKEQVLASSWGRPQRVNTTGLPGSTREQWVYGNGQYLYFHDDILVSWQTSSGR